MIKLAGEITIQQPVDQVFQFLTNLENATQWQTGVSESRLISNGPIQVGTQFEEVLRLMGRPVTMVCEITEYAPGKKLAWKSTSSSIMKYSGQFVFEPADGGTRLSYAGSAQLGGLWRLIEPLAALEAKNETKAELNKIKSVLETQPQ